MGDKSWYYSKTIWANALMLIGSMVLQFTGSDFLNLETQASLMAGVNVLLRAMTKQGLTA